MASAIGTLSPSSSFEPIVGAPVELVDGIVRIVAPNSGPFTYTGTNTYLIGIDRVAVVDPGPNDSRHLNALLAAIGGRKVEAILLTHTHRDHCGLARRLRRKTGAPIWSGGPHRLYREVGWSERMTLRRSCDFGLVPDQLIGEGTTFSIDGITLGAIGTPGHCANHAAFSIWGSPYLLIGDHVMGWSSTVVAPPDGNMGDYIASLEKAIVSPFSYYLPGHGDVIPDGRRHARQLLAHRMERNQQVLDRLAERPQGIGALMRRIYPDISPALRPAAMKTIEAHLEYLEEGGLVKRAAWPGGRYLVA